MIECSAWKGWASVGGCGEVRSETRESPDRITEGVTDEMLRHCLWWLMAISAEAR